MKIRAGKAQDLPLIFRSWLDSYRSGFERSDFGGPIPSGLYHEVTRATATMVMSAACASLLVACSDEDEDSMFGWLLVLQHRPPVLVYAYVKPDYRRLGYASELLEAAGARQTALCAFWTPDLQRVMRQSWTSLRASPRALRGVWVDGVGWRCCSNEGRAEDADRWALKAVGSGERSPKGAS